MPDTNLTETAIIITVPHTNHPDHSQVLVRLRGHIDPKTILVDFRPDPGASWTPADFFKDSVEVEHQ
jgi:hypothetical protein